MSRHAHSLLKVGSLLIRLEVGTPPPPCVREKWSPERYTEDTPTCHHTHTHSILNPPQANESGNEGQRNIPQY